MDSRAQLYPTLVAVSLTAVAFLASPASTAAASPLPTREPRLSIASPSTGTLVGGLIPISVAFDAGRAGKVTRLELWVDDLFYSTAPVEGAPARGSYTLDLDTGRLRNGQHTLQIRAFSGKRLVGMDQAVVTISNGGADIVPPLVSFFAPLEGETLTGTATIGVNATDNDQVALVGISVNRMPVLIKSNPPFTYQLDTTTLPMPDGTGMITLEAMAIDRANNIGRAKAIRVRVQNPVNATPLQADPSETPAPSKAKADAPRPGSAAVKATAPPKSAATIKITLPGAPTSRMAALPKSGGRQATAPKPTASIAKGSRPSLPPATRPELKSSAAAAAGAPSAETPSNLVSSLEGPRATSPSVPRRVAPPRSAPARVASAPDKPAHAFATPSRSPSTASRPTLMARAIVPPPPFASRPEPSAPAAAVAPSSRPMPATTGEARLSDARAAMPPTVRPAAPRSTPVPAESPRIASLPRPAPAEAPTPALEGGRLRLPVYVARSVPDSPARSRMHVVRKGERLAEIARRYRVTPRSIMVASGLHGDTIAPGRKLTIPGTFDIVVDNRRIEFDVNPRIEKGLPIAPFRHIFEHAGGVVVYYPADRSVKAAKPDKEVRLKIGSAEAMVNGAVVVMERPAVLDSGRTMVPVRFVTEALDMVAEYDVKTGNIYLVRK
jgi:LysM repeat protein